MKYLIPMLLFAAAPAIAADAGTAAPATGEAWAKQMTDPTRNAAAFKDPQAFMAWSAAMADPLTSAALAKQGLDPNTYIRMLSGMMNPATMQNYMQFVDPAIAMRWMGAGMDPNFYTRMLSMGMNPAMYGNWMSAPMNPQMWAPALQLMNPSMYTNMMMAPISPGAMNMMMVPMNPQTYMQWMGTGMNPQTYGTWGQMLPALPTPPAAPEAKP